MSTSTKRPPAWIFLAFSMILILSSCSNSGSIFTSSRNVYAKKLMSGPWLMNSVVTTQNTSIYDLYSEMDARDKDNSLIFNNDNTVISDEGDLKYNENDPQIIDKGNWKVSKDGKYLIIQEQGEESQLEIMELSASLLKLRAVDFDSSTNSQMSLTICYNH